VFSLLQLFDHNRFEHSAFNRGEPCSTGEQVANWLRQKLGREPSNSELKEQLAVTNLGDFGEHREHAMDNVLRETLHGMRLSSLHATKQLRVSLAHTKIATSILNLRILKITGSWC
jgi:hypothetical protein